MAIYSDNAVGLPLFQFELLRQQPDLIHGISTRQPPRMPRYSPPEAAEFEEWEISGNAKRPLLEADPPAYALLMRQRRMDFLAALGLDAAQAILSLTAGQQRHTANIACVGSEAVGAELNWERSLTNTDGVITDVAGVPLMSIHADCLPLVLYDPVRKVTATVHSGWRGTVAKIGTVTVTIMMNKYGSQPADILAGIGPGIGPCCYQVGEPVLSEVRAAFGDTVTFGTPDPLLSERDGHWYFDLWQANRHLLLNAGLLPQHIENSGLCTRCHADTFFSYRAIGEERRNAEGYGLFGSIAVLCPA